MHGDKNKAKETNDSAYLFESGPEYPHELLVVDSNNVSYDWILDSGCNIHATLIETLFFNLSKLDWGM